MRQPRLDRTIDDLIADARAHVSDAVNRWRPTAVYAAFSGGNDSTVMLDVVREQIDGVLHIDTTVGLRPTREFVERVCADWRLLLRVVTPPRSYADLVRAQGFYGPKDHGYAYRQLKKEAVRQFRREVLAPRQSTSAMLLTGMRAAESGRRMAHGSTDRREERIVWVNPLRDWTGDDMSAYRERRPDLPRNPVNDALGKSGECLCGCFSVGPVELPIIRDLDPDLADEIERLQDELAAQGSPYCRWGPGGQPAPGGSTGPLCAGCDALFDPDAVDPR